MLRKFGVSSLVLVVALFTALTVGASAQSGSGNEPGNVKGQSRSLLFVQNARGGTFTRIRGKSGGFRLTLHRVDPKVVFFSDRPVRDTGLLPQDRFIRLLWGPGDSPPNAAVEVLGGDKSQDTDHEHRPLHGQQPVHLHALESCEVQLHAERQSQRRARAGSDRGLGCERQVVSR